jgi:hypothetical protein
LSRPAHHRIALRLLVAAFILGIVPSWASAHTGRRSRASRRPDLFRSRRARNARTGRFRRRYRAVRGHLRFAHRRSRRQGYRTARYRRVMPGAEISPQRTEQIQEALVEAGDLHETPTGRWDAQTREAMKEYQTSNGFQPTGVPDAKSLMKLGLGPHPLPADVDPKAVARAEVTPSSPNAPSNKAVANIAQ